MFRDIAGSGYFPRLSGRVSRAVSNRDRRGFIRGERARTMTMWILRRSGGLTLREIGVAMEGIDYAAACMALNRFERRLDESPKLRNARQQTVELLNDET